MSLFLTWLFLPACASALTLNSTSLHFPQISFSGVFAAAHDLDIEWVVIKGISGYADGRKVKDSWRAFASFMAASLTAHILSDTIVFQAWPHFGSASEYSGHSGNFHVVFSYAISHSFPSARLWFSSSHNPTNKSFEKFASNQTASKSLI